MDRPACSKKARNLGFGTEEVESRHRLSTFEFLHFARRKTTLAVSEGIINQ